MGQMDVQNLWYPYRVEMFIWWVIICKNCNYLCNNQGRDGFMGAAGDTSQFRCCGWFDPDGSSI